MVKRLAVVVMVATGCGARAHHGSVPQPGSEITMYRDLTVVSQRVELEVPAGQATELKVEVPAGLTAEDVVVLDRGGLTISAIREAGAEHVPPSESAVPARPPPSARTTPTELTFVVTSRHAGRHALQLGYTTSQIHWEAAYTMTTMPTRDAVSMRGAIAIRNETGTQFARAHVFAVDAELGTWRTRVAERLGSSLTGAPASTPPMATPRDLGHVALGAGETRLELLPLDVPRKMRSVLVYDPIGTRLDHGGREPIRDATLGVDAIVPAQVTESFEIDRSASMSAGLPAGKVRLLERRADGTLTMLGEARLFDAATRVADVDTIAIGTAQGVTGTRTRRELSIDDVRNRLVEEFVLTIKNSRAHPVEVVMREHLYRGQNWTLGYYSAPVAAKEGPQQISLRGAVPARGETKVLYVVVYTWPEAK